MSFGEHIDWPRAARARRKLGTVPACAPDQHDWLILSLATATGFKPMYAVCQACGQVPADVVDAWEPAEVPA
jgi:hypothetical protein